MSRGSSRTLAISESDVERNLAERGTPNRGGPRRQAPCYREGPGATRAVNKTAKEGEQCARLPLSWGTAV
jgi:hypothetical protein